MISLESWQFARALWHHSNGNGEEKRVIFAVGIGENMLKHRFLLALTLLCATPAIFGERLEAQEQTLSFEELRDQGTLYFRKKRFKQAYRSLKEAIKMPQGADDYKAHYTLARTAAKLLLLEEAFREADTALTLANESERKKNAVNLFQQELKSKYGAVSILPATGETNRKGKVFLEAKTSFLNKKKKEVFQTIRSRFRETEIEIPTIIYLPHGQFLANNVPVKVVEGEDLAEVQLYLQVDRAVVEEAAPNWWWIGGGIAATLATGVATYFAVQDDIEKQRLKIFVPGPEPEITE